MSQELDLEEYYFFPNYFEVYGDCDYDIHGYRLADLCEERPMVNDIED